MTTATIKKSKSIIPETGFWFDTEKHRYYFDGKQMTGVTTILGVLAKPQLIQWAANETVKYIDSNLPVKREKNTLKISADDFKRVLEESRTAHAQKRDRAADTGHLAHSWCEAYIKGENPPLDENLRKMTDNFVGWASDNQVKFLASEKTVYDEDAFYGGTLDFLAEIEGKMYLGDIKTSSGIYPEMFYQTAAYQNALQKHENIKIDGHIIVNITKDGKLNVATSTEYQENLAVFMACLAIYRRQLQIKNSLKV